MHVKMQACMESSMNELVHVHIPSSCEYQNPYVNTAVYDCKLHLQVDFYMRTSQVHACMDQQIHVCMDNFMCSKSWYMHQTAMHARIVTCAHEIYIHTEKNLRRDFVCVTCINLGCMGFVHAIMQASSLSLSSRANHA